MPRQRSRSRSWTPPWVRPLRQGGTNLSVANWEANEVLLVPPYGFPQWSFTIGVDIYGRPLPPPIIPSRERCAAVFRQLHTNSPGIATCCPFRKCEDKIPFLPCNLCVKKSLDVAREDLLSFCPVNFQMHYKLFAKSDVQ